MTDDETPGPPPARDDAATPYTPPSFQAWLRRVVAQTLLPLPRPLRIVVVAVLCALLVLGPVVLFVWGS